MWIENILVRIKLLIFESISMKKNFSVVLSSLSNYRIEIKMNYLLSFILVINIGI